MAKNYKGFAYFESRPDIVKIFDDLEAFHDYCRMELLPYNEANLYNRSSPVWNQYHASIVGKKPRSDARPRKNTKSATV